MTRDSRNQGLSASKVRDSAASSGITVVSPNPRENSGDEFSISNRNPAPDASQPAVANGTFRTIKIGR